MRLIFSPFPANYQQYQFPYQVLLWREAGDSLAAIYNYGFLPFRYRQDLFYLSRSCRSNLRRAQISSENRRILARTQRFSFRVKMITGPLPPGKQKLLRDWARAAGWDIKAPTLKKLWQGKFFNYQLVASEGQKPISYSLLMVQPPIAHWAYVFLHPDYRRASLPMAVGLHLIRWARQKKLDYLYLGTCYGRLNYKRNFPGLEFFNGFYWSADYRELKQLLAEDWSGYLWQNSDYRQRMGKELPKALMALKK